MEKFEDRPMSPVFELFGAGGTPFDDLIRQKILHKNRMDRVLFEISLRISIHFCNPQLK